MKANISAILGIVVAINFLFGITLIFIQLANKKKALEYIYISFFLKAAFFLAPTLVMFGIDLDWGAWITGPIKVTLIPVIYLYFAKLDQSCKKLKRKDLWHFIPLLLDVILTIIIVPPYLEYTRQQEALQVKDALTMVWENNPYLTIMAITARTIALIQVIVYFFMILKKLKTYSHYLRNLVSEESYFNLNWLRGAAFMIIFLGLGEGIALFGAYNITGVFPAVLIIQIIYVIFFFIHSVLHKDVFLIEQDNSFVDEYEVLEKNKKNNDTVLNKILAEELFLNPKLDLETLSRQIGIAKYRISQMIKETGFKNFYVFINYYRIEKSKKLLLTIPDNMVIESIANKAGFNSRATFFRVFKLMTGMTPLQFQNNNLLKKDK